MRESPWPNQVAKKGKERDFQDVVKCEVWRRDWCGRECGYNEMGSKKKVRLIATSSLTVSWVLILGEGVGKWVTQSCLTLCDTMDCSSPGSSVRGILQARILEWVAIPSSRGASQPRNQTQISHTVGRFFTIWATKEVRNTNCNIRFLLYMNTQGM